LPDWTLPVIKTTIMHRLTPENAPGKNFRDSLDLNNLFLFYDNSGTIFTAIQHEPDPHPLDQSRYDREWIDHLHENPLDFILYEQRQNNVTLLGIVEFHQLPLYRLDTYSDAVMLAENLTKTVREQKTKGADLASLVQSEMKTRQEQMRFMPTT
jgi:hypothetical protein